VEPELVCTLVVWTVSVDTVVVAVALVVADDVTEVEEDVEIAAYPKLMPTEPSPT
jgi:hypothetical protein